METSAKIVAYGVDTANLAVQCHMSLKSFGMDVDRLSCAWYDVVRNGKQQRTRWLNSLMPVPCPSAGSGDRSFGSMFG